MTVWQTLSRWLRTGGKLVERAADANVLRVYGCPILVYMARMATMKTTLDIHDELLIRAKRHAKETGLPLRAVVEEGLRRVLVTAGPSQYKLPDLRVGDANAPDPLAAYSWPELRELIYGGSDAP